MFGLRAVARPIKRCLKRKTGIEENLISITVTIKKKKRRNKGYFSIQYLNYKTRHIAGATIEHKSMHWSKRSPNSCK